jgi:hypothetical protein
VKLVLLCSDPDVAVTVTVDGSGLTCTPHPVTKPSPTRPAAIKSIICKLRRFLKPRKQHSTHASAEPGNSGLRLLRSAAVVEVVVIVSCVVEAAPPDGVTGVGEKLHVAPEGNPEQVNVTAELNPFCGVTVTMSVTLCPAVTVSDDEAREMAKLGGVMLMV